MELARLRPVYAHEGPFATVYLEGRSPGEDAPTQQRLRWKALRERLVELGAPHGAVDSIESALHAAETGEAQTNGRVLVATESGVVLDEPWDAALGAGDSAHWTRLPELGAFVREEARSVRMLVALVDAQGAVIRQEVVAEQHQAHEVDAETVQGTAVEGTHKPRGQALSHNQIQRRAEHAARQNAEDVAAELRSTAASFHPEVLVLAGETQARTAVRAELSHELDGLCTEIDRGGDQDETAEQVLADQLREVAGAESARDAQTRTDQLNEGLAHERAVHGEQQVARAAEMGAVDILLLEHDTALEREAFLLKTCAETDSQVDLVAESTRMTDGIGALLRFPVQR